MVCNRQRIENIGNNSFNNNFNSNFNLSGGFPTNVMYGHAYVKNQIMNRIFSPEEGLKMGTIFPELVMTYEPGDSMAEMLYLRGGNR